MKKAKRTKLSSDTVKKKEKRNDLSSQTHKKENPIHIKLEYEEAVISKKTILTSQMNLLRIAKTINIYRAYRTQELILKTQFYKKIKEARENITQMKRILPEPEIPEILQKEERTEHKTNKKNVDRTIEEQLRDIQRRIEELQQKAY